jgi:hypothetical protein
MSLASISRRYPQDFLSTFIAFSHLWLTSFPEKKEKKPIYHCLLPFLRNMNVYRGAKIVHCNGELSIIWSMTMWHHVSLLHIPNALARKFNSSRSSQLSTKHFDLHHHLHLCLPALSHSLYCSASLLIFIIYCDHFDYDFIHHKPGHHYTAVFHYSYVQSSLL